MTGHEPRYPCRPVGFELCRCSAVSADVPVLLVVFNRPEPTRQVLDALRAARPARLFVAADGPRDGHPTDAARCAETRALSAAIDWPCEVAVLGHERNLGQTLAVPAAIDWFFQQVDAGVVLEDDCVVAPDFLRLASAVLDRYRDDHRVMYLSAVGLRPWRGGDTVRFAHAGNIWGWATWRRAWDGFDVGLADWPDVRECFGPGAPALRRAIGRKADECHRGVKVRWARAWHYHVAKQGGLVAVPRTNLVRNVGFGGDATNTASGRHLLAGLRAGTLDGPIRLPDEVAPDPRAEAAALRYHRSTRLDRVALRTGMQVDRALRGGTR